MYVQWFYTVLTEVVVGIAVVVAEVGRVEARIDTNLYASDIQSKINDGPGYIHI